MKPMMVTVGMAALGSAWSGDDAPPRHALGRGGADIGLAQHFQHGRAGEARHDGRPAVPSVTMGRIAWIGQSAPLAGSQPRLTANTSTSSSASTKLGMVKPATDTAMVSAVGEGVAVQGGVDAGRDAEADLERQRRQGDGERRRHALHHQVDGGLGRRASTCRNRR